MHSTLYRLRIQYILQQNLGRLVYSEDKSRDGLPRWCARNCTTIYPNLQPRNSLGRDRIHWQHCIYLSRSCRQVRSTIPRSVIPKREPHITTRVGGRAKASCQRIRGIDQRSNGCRFYKRPTTAVCLRQNRQDGEPQWLQSDLSTPNRTSES